MNNLENNKLFGLFYIKLLIIIIFLLICLSLINNKLIKNYNENYINNDLNYINKSAVLNIFKKNKGDNYKLIGLDSGDNKFGIYGVEIKTYLTQKSNDTLIGFKNELNDNDKFKLYEKNDKNIRFNFDDINMRQYSNFNIEFNIPFLININGFELHTVNYTPSINKIDFKGLNIDRKWVSLLDDYNYIETTSTSIKIKNININNNSFFNYKIQIKDIDRDNIGLNNIVLYSRFNSRNQPSLSRLRTRSRPRRRTRSRPRRRTRSRPRRRPRGF
jgi:hypothetical protein